MIPKCVPIIALRPFVGLHGDSGLVKNRARRTRKPVNTVANTEASQTVAAVTEVVSQKRNEVDPQLKQMALSSFSTTFRLEGELVGKVKAKVSKRGGVTMSLMPLTSKTGDSLAKLSGLSGDALEAYRQRLAMELKTEMNVLAGRIATDRNYEGGKVIKKADGTIGMEWKPIKEEVLTVVSPEAAMKVLGIDPSKWNDIKSLLSPEAPAPEAPQS